MRGYDLCESAEFALSASYFRTLSAILLVWNADDTDLTNLHGSNLCESAEFASSAFYFLTYSTITVNLARLTGFPSSRSISICHTCNLFPIFTGVTTPVTVPSVAEPR